MGKLGKIVNSAVGEIVSDSIDKPISVISKLGDKIKQKDIRNGNDIFKCEPGEKVLVIKMVDDSLWKDMFYVYDDPQHVKYKANRNYRVKHQFHILDETGKEIASAKEKLSSPLLSAVSPHDILDFIFKIKKEKAVRMRSQFAMKKRKYTLNNGWAVEGNLLGSSYKVSDAERPVATISTKNGFLYGYKCFITFPEQENELLILMIALAIDCQSTMTELEEMRDDINNSTL